MVEKNAYFNRSIKTGGIFRLNHFFKKQTNNMQTNEGRNEVRSIYLSVGEEVSKVFSFQNPGSQLWLRFFFLHKNGKTHQKNKQQQKQ